MMKRGYKVEEFIEKIQKLKAVRPDISVSSDFIVGFPGETEEDFLQTLNLVATIGFDTSFSFIYSPRPGTPAAKLHDGVDMAVKKERLQRLQHRLLQQATLISESMVGTIQPILITGFAKKQSHLLSGRTENNRVVNFEGDPSSIGQIHKVRITEALPNSLRGEIQEFPLGTPSCDLKLRPSQAWARSQGGESSLPLENPPSEGCQREPLGEICNSHEG
jgi:tRNA-2-methylthio-N6-dimethylallyladenosine synthase